MRQRLIKDVIKNQSVITVPATATVRDAAKAMAEKRIGAILVIENGLLAGIFTERDGLFRVLAERLDPDTTPVAQVMTRNIMTIAPDKPLVNALHLMHDNGFRHLPVVVRAVPVGMISVRDALDYELVSLLKDIEKKESLTEILR
jgi:CBS domain-containing protein